ncbi:MAG: recombinase family protein, partial [Chloroflexi bacterium]|nr:recombinase family protein [Chloroflexota bacterium]
MLPARNASSETEWVAPDASPTDSWWAIYARISDSGEDEAKRQLTPGVERQVADCLARAHEFGAKRIRFYREGGSAFDEDKERAGFKQLIEDIQAGEIAHVIAWRAERLARKPKDAEALISASKADSVTPIATIYTCDGINSETELGKMLFRQLVLFGRWESLQISSRVRRHRQESMKKGRFTGSPPAFGHLDGTRWRATAPKEVALIREGADRIIAGQGVRTILRDWRDRGVRTRKGSLWRHRAWIKMITSPRMVGGRMMAGEETVQIGKDDEGRPWIAPILDRETWDAVRRVLLDPSRRKHDRGGKPRHLLTGLMLCGLCAGVLRAKGQSGKSHGPGYWTYGCVNDAYHDEACGRVWIKGADTDAYIENVTLSKLREPTVRRALSLIVGGSSADADAEVKELRLEFDEVREEVLRLERLSLEGSA